MTLTKFLESLFDNGRVRVPSPNRIAREELQSARDVLVRSEAVWRRNLPPDVPEFEIESGLWAAEQVFRAAQFQVFRDVNAEFIEQAFKHPPQMDDSPATHYSVDVCFRYLPDVLRLSRLASKDDPLNQHLECILSHWPLSAVGVLIIPPPRRSAAFQHVGLSRMLIDRTIEKSDERLMADPQIQKSIKIAMGAFPELVPALSKLTETRKPPND